MTTVEMPEAAQSFRALREAVLTAAATLNAAIAHGPVPLPLIADLDDALGGMPQLSGAVRDMLDTTDPGRAVAEDLRRWSEELVRTRERLSQLRAGWAEVAATEAQVRETAAAAEAQEQRIADLHRAQRLADRLDELRAARVALEEQYGAQADRLSSEEDALRPALDRAIDLAGDLAEDLRRETVQQARQAAELAGEVAARQAELAASQDAAAASTTQMELLTAEIEAASQRQRQLTGELDALVQRHRRHTEADRLLAEALARPGNDPAAAVPNIAEAQAELAAIDEQLGRIDGVLRTVLVAAEDEERTRMTPIRPGGN